jgi:hypothetical protein
MAEFLSSGVEAELRLLDRLADLPEDLQAEILTAQAREVVEAVREFGRRYHVKRTGNTLRSLTASKPKRDKDGHMSATVTFVGKNEKGVRYAEIAFVNNYGKKTQAARPFFTRGVKAAEEPAFKIAEKKYNAWADAQERKG